MCSFTLSRRQHLKISQTLHTATETSIEQLLLCVFTNQLWEQLTKVNALRGMERAEVRERETAERVETISLL